MVNPFRIAISPRGYDSLFDSLVGAVPAGKFYDHTYPLVMWSGDPSRFVLYTDNLNVPVSITVERLVDFKPTTNPGNLIQDVSIVPVNEIESFKISLGKGKNRLIATEQIAGGRTAYLEVVASTNTLFFEVMGREINVAQEKVNEQSQALYSKYSTRMLDQVIQFQGLLPSIQSMKILSTKLLVRSAVHFPAREIGVRNLIESFTLNTPVLQSQRESSRPRIERSRIQRGSQNISGKEAHVWFPNLSVTRWVAFTKMADALKQNYKINSLTDDQVKVTYKDKIQTHQFDFDEGTNFITNLSITDCFNGIEVFGKIKTKSSYVICVWSYPFDTYVTEKFPIGRSRTLLDLDIPFDSGFSFDTDPVDPWVDGWVGWSLDGRFDDPIQDLALDSSVAPALGYVGEKCVYTRGPYTQLFNSTRSDIDIDYTVGYDPAHSVLKDYTYGPIQNLEMDFPVSGYGSGDLVAGSPVIVVLKYADSKMMTNPSGSGSVTVQNGAYNQTSPVTGGYSFFSLMPQVVGENEVWTLSDGVYSGVSLPKKVIAGPFGGLIISVIPNQTVGVSFSVTVQATDAYGNPVTEVGLSTKVNVVPAGGFAPATVTPLNFDLVNGFATASLTMTQAGTGHLNFLLGAVTASSNTFTVS